MSDLQIDPDLLPSYMDESGICMSILEEKLLQAEKGETSAESVKEMFRAAHSMKGMAAFLGLNQVRDVTHGLETVLSKIRDGVLEFSREIVDALFEGLNTIGEITRNIKRGSVNDLDIAGIMEKLESVAKSVGKDDNPAVDIGPVPEFLTNLLTDDDRLAIMMARNSGMRIFVIRIPLTEALAAKRDVVAMYKELEKAVVVESTIPLQTNSDSPWLPLEDYSYDVCTVCFAQGELEKALENIPMPECLAWELCMEGVLRAPFTIKKRPAINIGQRMETLLIRPDMAKHFSTWKSQTSEELDKIDEILVDFEKDPAKESSVRELFQLFHRLKASSASMGLAEMSRIAHNAETALAPLRENLSGAGYDLFQALYSAKDFLKECLSRVVGGNTAAPDAAMVEKRLIALQYADMPPVAVVAEWRLNEQESSLAEEAVAAGKYVWKLTVKLFQDTPLPDLRLLMILRNISDIAEILSSSPTMEELEAGEAELTLHILLTSKKTSEEIRKTAQADMVERTKIEKVSTTGAVKKKETAFWSAQTAPDKKETISAEPKPGGTTETRVSPVSSSDTVRVDIERLNHIMNITGELVIIKARIAQLADALADHMRATESLGLDAVINGAKGENGFGGMNGRALTEKHRKLASWLGGLKSAQEKAGAMREAALTLHQQTGMLQNCVMQMRMAPIGPLFKRFHRVVRDVCKARNRDAELRIFGEDTELDKKLIDELSDPLTHLVRNAVDHGIESAEDRKKARKPEQGTVKLEAFHSGGQICIRVSDDGRGLDVARIREKAVSHGLVSQETIAGLSDQEVMRYIFHPGLSTAEKVTDVSGRGVGMDIVKSKITDLKGKIDIESAVGQGSSFTIKLPLTLALIRALLAEIGGGYFAFPIESIREIVDLTRDDIHSVEGKGRFINLRDEVISLISLDSVIGLPPLRPGDTKVRAVVTKGGGETVAIPVDKVIGNEEIVVKPLTDEFSHVKGVSGATILGDGRIALIINVTNVIEQATVIRANTYTRVAEPSV